MIGAIAGDIIGSTYERDNVKTKHFPLFTEDKHFTDDTVMTIATIDKLMNNRTYVEVYQEYGRKYPNAGYGKMFKAWFESDSPQPYGSYANGSAMRVSPIGLMYPSYSETVRQAYESSAVTHNHIEATNAAECIAVLIWMARSGRCDKTMLRNHIEMFFGYDMSFDLMELKKTYVHDVSAKGTMPVALKAFFDSTDYEDCIRLAISIGGDSDTIACIAGAIAEAYYKEIPKYIIEETRKRLPSSFVELIDAYYKSVRWYVVAGENRHLVCGCEK